MQIEKHRLSLPLVFYRKVVLRSIFSRRGIEKRKELDLICDQQGWY
jgi:hypothetical protein